MKTLKSFSVKIDREIKIHKIENTNFVFYESIITQGDESKITTGVTSIENVNSVKGLDTISDIVSAPNMYRGNAVVVGITKSDFDDMISGNKHITKVVKQIEDISQLKDHILVLWNIGSHKICDLNHNFISIPIYLGYIDGGITNEYYDLDKLLIKLKNDPHVCNRDSVKITNIPYYNATDYSNKSIEFQYLMDTDEYQKTVNMDSFMLRKHIMSDLIGADDCKYNIM